MGNFVAVRTLFDSGSERSVSALKEIYNGEKLSQAICSLLDDHIDPKSIKNKRVLLKPNWVKHSFLPDDEICLRTHDMFLLKVLEHILESNPSKVVIGDAPIQGCRWNDMLGAHFSKSVAELSQKFNIPIVVKDFRRVIFDTDKNSLIENRISIEDFIIFDVGRRSYLEPISVEGKNPFRVSQYNPDKFINTHRPGVHKYCITKELFDADIIISLPKVKTHQKAGITGALKNIVGLNGDKDFLPHHRIGGDKMGGDSYQGANFLRYWSELALDSANRNKGRLGYWLWTKMASVLWRISLPGPNHRPSAAWFGNDTTWRMVMDLNLIVLYGTSEGRISEAKQRQLYSFSDGVIAGQGDGPLRPIPLELGIVSLSDNSAWADLVHARLMQIDIDKIPLLNAAREFEPEQPNLFLNGKEVSFDTFQSISVKATMPPGWINYKAGKSSK